MDRKIEKKRWTWQKISLWTLLAAVSVFLFYGFLSRTSGIVLNIEKQKLIIGEVTYGDFQEFIPVDGNVLPITTVVIDAIEAGRVEEKYVEDGAMVTQGQPLLKLANTDLQLDFLNRETQVFDLINNLQNTRNSLEQNKVNRLNQLADITYNLEEATRLYKNNQKLYEDRAISLEEFNQSKSNYTYQLRKKKLIEQALVQDSISATDQISQMRASLDRMRMNLEVMQQKTEDLVIKAPIDGQITSLTAEVGESKGKGQNLAQLDVLNGFKVRASIDEHFISRVFIGQPGQLTLQGKTYTLDVFKIFPQVNNGKFQVDLSFNGAVPKDLKRGQSLQIRLQLGGVTETLMVPRGGFYQQTGGNWIFVLDKTGQSAEKRTIKLGRQNPDYYEVLDGLADGERVLVSSYQTLGDATVLKLKD